jgi:hypothetical protein
MSKSKLVDKIDMIEDYTMTYCHVIVQGQFKCLLTKFVALVTNRMNRKFLIKMHEKGHTMAEPYNHDDRKIYINIITEKYPRYRKCLKQLLNCSKYFQQTDELVNLRYDANCNLVKYPWSITEMLDLDDDYSLFVMMGYSLKGTEGKYHGAPYHMRKACYDMHYMEDAMPLAKDQSFGASKDAYVANNRIPEHVDNPSPIAWFGKDFDVDGYVIVMGHNKYKSFITTNPYVKNKLFVLFKEIHRPEKHEDWDSHKYRYHYYLVMKKEDVKKIDDFQDMVVMELGNTFTE